MAELPEGVELPTASIASPRPSAAAVLSRETQNGLEILLCHRVAEVPAFPDFWAFPGGGVSRVTAPLPMLIRNGSRGGRTASR